MKAVHHITILILLVLTMPLHAQQEESAQMRRQADEYAKCEDAQARLRRANDFFAFLHKTGYIDEPVSFPAGSHIDSVDVNVY